MGGWTTGGALAGTGVLVAVLAFAPPAWAHTGIDVDNPQAGAANVTMTVTAEAESNKAGIVSVRVQLPPVLPAGWVSLVSGPPGWQLSPTADGYTVAGPALPVHQNARYVLRLRQLPGTAGVLTFKTVVGYSDGQVDRWIEETTAANPQPDRPAPTVSLRPAGGTPGSATAVASGQPSPTPVAAPASRAGGQFRWWLAIAGLLLAALAVGAAAVLLRRRARAGTPTGPAG